MAWGEPQTPRKYLILSLDIFRPPLSLIHFFFPSDGHHYSFLMCPMTRDKVCYDKWTPKMQHYFTDCFSGFDALSKRDPWACRKHSSSGCDSLNDMSFLSLKGDYEGENVEPNDRKVSGLRGLTDLWKSQPEVTCWNLGIAQISHTISQKCHAVEVCEYFLTFQFASMWSSVWLCMKCQLSNSALLTMLVLRAFRHST